MTHWTDTTATQALRDLYAAGVRAADPLAVLAAHLPEVPRQGRVIVVGVGKAAAKMAQAVEAAWADVPLTGLVIAPHGAGLPLQRIALRYGKHPTPDAGGAAAAAEMLAMVQGLTPDDLVLALISGGGSSLSTLPAPGLSLEDLIATNQALLASGAVIGEMNCIRKHLSAFSGGRLAAAAHPARVVTLAISDVPGDDPEVIASGPTVADPTSFAEARAIVARYGMELPPSVAAHLAAGAEESPKPGDARLKRAEFRMIATPMMALQAMAEAARGMGLTPLILGDALEGEARHVGTVLGGMARSVAAHGLPIPAPCLLLSGGECTVTLAKGTQGAGGRNTECLLGITLALNAAPGIWAMCADTDGIDGKSEHAGAIAGPGTLAAARAKGLDPQGLLAAHRSLDVFAAAEGLLTPGPTLTNVNDVRAILVT
ncbi:glycerate kinase [Roseococcus sp. SDR]|uniref:glycerate kinase type-2 family protein n=1 Tax=Roseococcus sp. SDR TaxID=2835532 RepID=UPI001BD196AB|nr:glycerate kinase [Roseococcus sp. SDR]MBS7789985.1 glycerate kinase [Roseococcus sp. SDR]MBV1845299.1 glycerate kinase [Roseococcus sp. SDR]